MAVDYAPRESGSTRVLPGSVDTPMLRASANAISPDDPDRRDQRVGLGTSDRPGRPAAEIADACVFLASPLASYVTGAELRVDGGLLAGVALRAPGEEG